MPFSLLQDLHLHTTCSSCCRDPRMTPGAIAEAAAARGYTEVCLTDHVWSVRVEGASDWYRPQDIAHVLRNRPLPPANFSFFLGCEAEFLGGAKLSILPDEFELFDFVAVSVNHMHMRGFVRPAGTYTPESMAALVLTRLEALTVLPLPWTKIGIAHLSTPLMYAEGSAADVLDAMDAGRLRAVLRKLAALGAGIELNARAFAEWDNRKGAYVTFFRLAAEAGCRFYAASDAHGIEEMGGVQAVLPQVVDALGLTGKEQYFLAR